MAADGYENFKKKLFPYIYSIFCVCFLVVCHSSKKVGKHCSSSSMNGPTILILEKLTRPSSVKLGVPSSIKTRSVRYIPRYGTHGGLQLQPEYVKVKHAWERCTEDYLNVKIRTKSDWLFQGFPQIFEPSFRGHCLLQFVHQGLSLWIIIILII